MEQKLKESELYLVNSIIDNFDFKRVHICMQHLKWVWAMSKTVDGVPSIDEMKKTAKRILSEVLIKGKDEDSYRISTGGFQASYVYERLSLKFVLTDLYDEDVIDDTIYQKLLFKEKRIEKIDKLLNEK